MLDDQAAVTGEIDIDDLENRRRARGDVVMPGESAGGAGGGSRARPLMESTNMSGWVSSSATVEELEFEHQMRGSDNA